jgi:hypothetical protein
MYFRALHHNEIVRVYKAIEIYDDGTTIKIQWKLG